MVLGNLEQLMSCRHRGPTRCVYRPVGGWTRKEVRESKGKGGGDTQKQGGLRKCWGRGMPVKLNSQGSDSGTKSHIKIKSRRADRQDPGKITSHNDVNALQWSVRRRTSLLCFCRNSISWCVNVVIEMDFTLWGGFSPRLCGGGESSPTLAQEQEGAAYQCVQCGWDCAIFIMCSEMWQPGAMRALLMPHFQSNNRRRCSQWQMSGACQSIKYWYQQQWGQKLCYINPWQNCQLVTIRCC